MPKVVVTGMGAIACNGIGLDSFWENISTGRSGIQSLSGIHSLMEEGAIGGLVRDFRPEKFMPENLTERITRYSQFGVASARMALADSGLRKEVRDNPRTGIIVGTGLGGILFHEDNIASAYEHGLHRIHPHCIPRIAPNSVSAQIAMNEQVTGLNYCLSTACSSGLNAIGEAYQKIAGGHLDYAICGGVESPLTPFTYKAYAKLKVLARNEVPEKASRPFDKKRTGFVLAEGAGMLVLEREDLALGRGAKIYGEISAFESRCGAFHIALPDPSADDIAGAMEACVQKAGIKPSQIDLISTHGTGTLKNDQAEIRGMEKIFPHRDKIHLTATKSVIGHAIGAAGALETIVSFLCLTRQVVPPTINLEEPETDWGFHHTSRQVEINYILNNSFGFGSNNSCLILKRYANES